MHGASGMILEATCSWVFGAFNESRIIVTHALKLTFEASTNGAHQAVHVEAINDSVLKPCRRVQFFVVLCDPFINALCQQHPLFSSWSAVAAGTL